MHSLALLGNFQPRLSSLRFLLLYLCVLTLPFALYSPIRPYMYLFALFAIASALDNGLKEFKQSITHPLFIAGLLFVAVKGAFYLITGTPGVQDTQIATALSLAIFPLFFHLHSYAREEIAALKEAFIIAMLASPFFIFSDGLSFLEGGFNHHLYEDHMIMHRPYYGMYLLLAAIFSLEFIRGATNKGFWVFTLAFCSIWMILIYAKMTWVTYVILLVVFIWNMRMQREETPSSLQKWILPLMLGFSALVGILAYFTLDPEFIQGLLLNSFSDRIAIWQCSIGQFTDVQSILVGVGFGNQNNLIDMCFNALGMELRHYNAHNQFLAEWMNSGLLGLASSIFIFYVFWKKLKGTKLTTPLLFIAMVVLGAMTENIFYRLNGVLLFGVFASILYQEMEHRNRNFASE